MRSLTAGLCLLQIQNSPAQMSPATLPNLTVSMGGEIFAIVVQDDGKVILGGDFTSVNGVARTNLARVNPNGSLDVTWSPNPDGVVSNLILNGSDLYASGAFIHMGGEVRPHLAKLSILDAGLADPAWAPQPNGPVYCLALAGSNLYVGGGFTHIGGLDCNGAARVSAQGDGSASWTVDAEGGQVLSMVATSDHVFLGGSFTTINGVPRRNLAKLTASTGAVDANWNPAPDAVVNALTLSGPFLVLGGQFGSLGGAPSQAPLVLQTNLARVNISGLGTADTAWRPHISISCTNAKLYSILSDESYIYVSGQFENAGGVPRHGIARFRILDGSVDDNWVAAIRMFNRVCVLSDCWYPSCRSFDGDFVRVRTLVRVPSGIYAGGRFSLVGNAVALGTAKLDALSGAPDTAFAVQTGREIEDRSTGLGQIFAITTQDDGKLLLGGRFELIDGKPRLNLARLNVDGTLDEFWQPNPNDRVLALATRGNDIFVGGDFTWIGGINRSNLAKLSATGSDAADPDWAPNPNSRVNSVAVRGTNLCAVGDFTAFGDPPVTRPNVAFILTEETGQVLPQVPEASVTGVGFALYGRPVNVVMDDTYAYLHGELVVIGSEMSDRWYNLGRIRIATGQADDSWRPPFAYASGLPDPFENLVEALVVDGTNIFIGGSFSFASGQTNLARLDYVTGAVNTTWNPRISSDFKDEMLPRLILPCSALALCGSNLYVAGTFTNLSNTGLSRLARLDAFGTGAVDTTWMPQPDGEVYRLCTRSNDVFAVGYFGTIGGASRSKLAFLPTADAPSMFRISATNFRILRNPGDGFEVTHFRVTEITGGIVYHTNGVTPVNVGDFVTTEEGEGGLLFIGTTNDTVTAVSALNATPSGAGSASSTLNFGAPQPPVFSFSSASYATNEGATFVIVRVLKHGGSGGSVYVETAPGTAVEDDPLGEVGDYSMFARTLSFLAGESYKDIRITVLDNEDPEGDKVFFMVLKERPGSGLLYPGTATITIIDDDCAGPPGSFAYRLTPGEAPLATGALRVDLQPTNVGKWRLAGDLLWRDSGTEAHGLVDGYYQVLLKPVLGYYPPSSTLTAQVDAGVTNTLTALYFRDPDVEYGELSIVLAPESVASSGGMWMAEDGVWRSSGDKTTLPAGAHEIQFREVSGWSTPRNTIATVVAGAECNKSASYEPTNAPGVPAPSVLSFSTVTNHQDPYQFNGLVETDFGFGSGVVVKERVVLTAAHVLFDDYSLSYAKRAKWFFQKHQGDYEPPAQVPRGWYVFQGYAADRAADVSGLSNFASENRDAAAMYFVRNNQPTYDPNLPGRGGYGGFLSSAGVGTNEWLQSPRPKMLVGYPIDGISPINQGKMHATAPSNLAFSHVSGSIYATTNVVSHGGNSGGPLYVQADDGVFYPAAIYLGGGSQSLVRAIDEQVVCLINFAEISGNDDSRHTGGGVAVWSAGVTTDAFDVGLVGVRLSPSGARLAGAAWRVRRSAGDVSAYFDNNTLVSPLIPGPFLVEFRPAPGFATPATITVRATASQTNWYSVNYPTFRLSNPAIMANGGVHLTVNGATGRVYAVEASTDLTNWVTLATLTNRTGAVQFTNQTTSDVARRFYRGREL